MVSAIHRAQAIYRRQRFRRRRIAQRRREEKVAREIRGFSFVGRQRRSRRLFALREARQSHRNTASPHRGRWTWVGRHVHRLAAQYRISVHHRKVREILPLLHQPRGDKRAIPCACRDGRIICPRSRPPQIWEKCGAAACGRAPGRCGRFTTPNTCRQAGILTSLDGGGTAREHATRLLAIYRVAVVAEALMRGRWT